MNPKIKKYLEDIRVAIQEIEETVSSKEARFDTFLNDYVFRKFVERNIEIMGEAVNRILKVHPDIKITNARKVVDCRNYVIHSYDTLTPEILWAVVMNHLPLLKEEVIRLLNEDK
ncbi:DUF86 domain-containing protein [bacterium]|nr:DUF86 domain-containing protein [bacterium]